VTPEDTTVVLGIPIPSTSPIFLSGVALHVLVGLVCVVAGAIAMLSPKRSGRHPTFGTIYYWSLVAVFVSATGLSIVRWAEDYHLFILGLLALIAASLGRTARRRRWARWVPVHISGMGLSYILLLTAVVEGSAADQLLVAAGSDWNTPHHPCSPEASARSAVVAAAPGLSKGSNNAIPISNASCMSSRSPVVRSPLPVRHAAK
jgi:hypothetical protein